MNEKSGFIDLKGNIVIPFNYEYCDGFSEGLAVVRQDGLYGFINKKENLSFHVNIQIFIMDVDLVMDL